MNSRVTLLPAHLVITVADSETILDAALRAGFNLPHSCRAGHCASCRARLVAGAVSYPKGRPQGLMPEEEREGYALLCQAHAATAELRIEVRQIRPPAPDIQVKTVPARIERMQPLAPDVMQVFLRLPANETFHFAAGQYLDVLLSGHRRRSFSIANPPHDAALLELHIRRVANGEFTQSLFGDVPKTSLLRIEGPLGQFWFREESVRPAILIGGGTGYAPLKAMLRHLLERGDQRPLRLFWGARSRIDLYEHDLVLEWCRRFRNLQYTPVLSAAQEAGFETGLVHEAALRQYPNLQGVDVYASGPPQMIEAIRSEFPAHGLVESQLFFDSFDYAADSSAERSP
ncbi:MAG TPA: 2Fe-2S iron-sulfur cluster-binding protein [Steroidobacteraceae bacterium]|nr:2Fe-2S iron-sulfur cluster-binding protein [Steroidobacteraceae bacterium]